MQKSTPRIFVPLWHPPEPFEAGGLYRARRTLESTRDFYFEIIDSDTTKIDARAINGRLRTYRARHLAAPGPRSFRVMRFINYSVSLLWITVTGIATADLDGVYVPTSELPHVALAGFLVAKARRVPLIFCNLNVRGVDAWSFNRMLHNRADGVITISHALAAELRADGVRSPIDVGTVGVDDRSIATRSARYDGIFVGRHTTEKGVDDLLRIWAEIVRRRPGTTLLMLGPVQSATRERLEGEIARAQLEGLVEIRGMVSDDEKWQAFAEARVCVFPSHVEGFGIVPIEAHFAGLPVVAYDLPVYAETIANSPAATLVPVGDVDRFVEETLTFLEAMPSDRLDRARIMSAGFSWSHAAAIESSLIKKIVSRRSKSSTVDNVQKDDRFSSRVVAELVRCSKDLGNMIDVGCGTGGVLDAASGYARTLSGIDRGAAFILEARRRLPDAELSVGDVSNLSFPDGVFDTVTLCDVIEHLDSPVVALREIRRVLKIGGQLLVTTPNSDTVVRRMAGRRWFGLADPTHIMFFTPFSLTTLLARSGFDVRSSRTLSASGSHVVSATLDRLRQGGTIATVATKSSA